MMPESSLCSLQRNNPLKDAYNAAIAQGTAAASSNLLQLSKELVDSTKNLPRARRPSEKGAAAALAKENKHPDDEAFEMGGGKRPCLKPMVKGGRLVGKK
jgi:hypothetical protein